MNFDGICFLSILFCKLFSIVICHCCAIKYTFSWIKSIYHQNSWDMIDLSNDGLEYLRSRTGMRSGLHRSPRIQDRPLTQPPSEPTHYRSLHLHTHWLWKPLWYRQIHRFFSAIHDGSVIIQPLNTFLIDSKNINGIIPWIDF